MAATVKINEHIKSKAAQKLKDNAKTKIKALIFTIIEEICNYFMSEKDISSNINFLQDSLDNTQENQRVELMITVAWRKHIIQNNHKTDYLPECISFRNDPKKIAESKACLNNFKHDFLKLIEDREQLILPFDTFNIEKWTNNLQTLLIYPKVKFHYYYNCYY